jgi:TolB protein
VFESDRGGQQQIYVMGADGSNPRRISFGEGSYSQPAWSPRGDYIAFTKRTAGLRDRHHEAGRLGRAPPHEGFHNESPTWAPERPVHPVLPRSRAGRRAASSTWWTSPAGSSSPVPTPGAASDPTWSPLLSDGR